MAKFSALAILLQSSRKSTAANGGGRDKAKEKDAADNSKEVKDMKVSALVFACTSKYFASMAL